MTIAGVFCASWESLVWSVGTASRHPPRAFAFDDFHRVRRWFFSTYRNCDKRPRPIGTFSDLPGRDRAAVACSLIESGTSSSVLPDAVARDLATRAIASRCRCSTTRPTRRRRSAGARSPTCARVTLTWTSSNVRQRRPLWLQGNGAPRERPRAASRASSSRSSTPTSCRRPTCSSRASITSFDPRVAVAQCRWQRISNRRDFSSLTEVQALMLDGHFMMEGTAGCTRLDRFFNFNGNRRHSWRRLGDR